MINKQRESLRKFNLCFHEVVKKVDQENCGILNYKKAVQVLTELGFMHLPLSEKRSNNKERQLLFDIWRTLRGNTCQGVNIRNFKLFLLAIMKFNFSWMKTPSYNNEICLSLSNSNMVKSELKNYSWCKNNMTLDNLSSIKPELTNPISNLKEMREFRAHTPTFNLTSLNKNPTLQKFLSLQQSSNESCWDKENSVKKQLNMDSLSGYSSWRESPKMYELLHNNRILTPKVFDSWGQDHRQNINLCSYETSHQSCSQVLGDIGVFDQVGDFYFQDDKELSKVHQYFILFYNNRMEYSANNKTVKLMRSTMSQLKLDSFKPRKLLNLFICVIASYRIFQKRDLKQFFKI